MRQECFDQLVRQSQFAANTSRGFFAAEDQAKQQERRLLIVLPGGGSTCHCPPLYYSTNLAMELGYDVLNIEYEFSYIEDSSRRPQLVEGIAHILDAFQEQARYDHVAFLCKSLGCRILAKGMLGMLGIKPKKVVLLTPDYTDPNIVNALAMMPSVLHIWAELDKSKPTDIANQNLLEGHRVLGMKGADHGFDIEGDIAASIDSIAQIVAEFRRFLLTPKV